MVTEPGAQPTEARIIEHCRAHLAKFKCPTAVTFADALPRNAVGKVLKRELREPYWRELPREVN